MTHWTERHFRGECGKLWGLEEQLTGKRAREGHRIPHRRMVLEKSRMRKLRREKIFIRRLRKAESRGTRCGRVQCVGRGTAGSSTWLRGRGCWCMIVGMSKAKEKWSDHKGPYWLFCDRWCLFGYQYPFSLYAVSHFCLASGLLDERLYLLASFANGMVHVTKLWSVKCKWKYCVELLLSFPSWWLECRCDD